MFTDLRHRDSLPSITNLDFDKYRLDKADHNRYSMPGFNTFQKNALSSPPTTYSGPPPPYSSAASVTNSSHGMAGYISPPETNSRRSTRDDKETAPTITSLPSISEALKHADPVATPNQQFTTKSQPNSAVAQTFADAPAGPGNPFSQTVHTSATSRSSFSAVPEPGLNQVPPPPAPSELRAAPPIHNIGSPRSSANHRPSVPNLSGTQLLDSPFRGSFSTDSARPGYPFPDYPAAPSAGTPQTANNFRFEPLSKPDGQRNPFAKPDPLPYNETVKRHLDVYDAEVALNEVPKIYPASYLRANMILDS